MSRHADDDALARQLEALLTQQPTADEHLSEETEFAELSAVVRGLADLAELGREGADSNADAMLIGSYEVREVLGRGSQSTAILAFDHDLRRLVVLKLYHRDEEEQWRSRLLAEGRRLAGIDSPHVAKCFGVDRAGRLPFLILEFVAGRRLDLQLQTWSSERLLPFLLQLIDGIEAIHAAGILHGDLKPSNILIDHQSKPKIIDLGLAASLLAGVGSGGTPEYAAPEQVGEDLGPVGPWTDVFGFGAVLYFLLCGKPLYAASTRPEVLSRAKRVEFDPLDHTALRERGLGDVAAVCQRCLIEQPKDRFQSIAHVKEALSHALSGPVSGAAEKPIAANRTPVALIMGLALTAVVVATAVFSLGGLSRRGPAPPAAGAPQREPLVENAGDPEELYDVLQQKLLLRQFPLTLELPGARIDESGVRHFIAGSPMEMRIQSDRDMYVRVYCVGKGEVTEILPNADFNQGKIAGGVVHEFPAGQFSAKYTESEGVEYIYLHASPSAIKVNAAAQQIGPYLTYDSREMANVWRGMRGVDVKSRVESAEVLIPILVAPSKEGDLRIDERAESETPDCGEAPPAETDESQTDEDDAEEQRQAVQRVRQVMERDRGLPFEMIPTARLAVEYAKRVEDVEMQVRLHLAILGAYRSNLRYGKALDEIELAIKSVRGTDAAATWLPRCQLEHGNLLNDVGRFGESEKAFEAALKGFEKVGTDADRSRVFSGKAARAAGVGDDERAIQLYLKGLQLGKELSTRPTARLNLAQLYARNGDYHNAVKTIQASLREVETLVPNPADRRELQARGNQQLGTVYFLLRNRDQAVNHYQKAITIVEQMLKASPADFRLRHNLGTLLLSCGESQRALSHLREAMNAMPRGYIANQTRRMLAVAYGMQEDYDRCERLLNDALQQAMVAQRRTEAAQIHRERGAIRLFRRDLAGAAKDYERAVDLQAEHYEDAAYDLTAAEASAFGFEMRGDIMRLLQVYAENREANRRPAYDIVWRSFARNLRWLRWNRDSLRQMVQQDRKSKRLHAQLILLSRQIAQTRGDAESVAELVAEKERIERSLVNRASGRPGPDSSPIKLPDFAQLLAPDQAYVHFVARLSSSPNPFELDVKKRRYVQHYDAFIIRRTEQPDGYRLAWVTLGERDAIDNEVQRWRRRLQSLAAARVTDVAWYRGVKVGPARPPTATGSPEQRLRQLVWKPIESELGGARHVVITPDGELARIPWAALPGKRTDRFLIDDYVISTLEHGEQLVRSRRRREAARKAKRLLAIGGVDYGTPSGDAVAAYPSIAGSEQEVQEIAGGWRGGAELLIGIDATRAEIVSRLPDIEFLHLATHGNFALPHLKWDPDAQSGNLAIPRSLLRVATGRNQLAKVGVALANANLDPGGYWTAGEIASRVDLGHLELVTLSACDTAEGTVSDWFGTYSLQRAFSTAGARSVLASQWPVHDEVTRALMVQFYRRLAQGMSKADALREAQLALIRKPQDFIRLPKNNDASLRLSPHLWASWQLNGDWR